MASGPITSWQIDGETVETVADQSILKEIMIHTVKGFGIVSQAEIDVFLEFSCFFHDPALLLLSHFSRVSLCATP